MRKGGRRPGERSRLGLRGLRGLRGVLGEGGIASGNGEFGSKLFGRARLVLIVRLKLESRSAMGAR